MEEGNVDNYCGMRRRVTAAALTGIVLVIIMWILTPLHDTYFRLQSLTDNYLPVGPLFVLLLMAAAYNPLMRMIAPALVLDRHQLALVFSILLIGGTVSRFVMVAESARAVLDVATKPELTTVYDKINPPPSLFPETLEYGARTPVSEAFFDRLDEGEKMPLAVWIKPVFAWGVLGVAVWLFMIGVAIIVYPQWRHNERLTFPLLQVYEAPMGEPEPGRYFPPIFRNPVFWAGAGVILIIWLLHGLSIYFPGRVPALPMRWELRPAFDGTIFGRMPPRFMNNQIIFSIIGIAFLLPARIGFSIWFFVVVYFLEAMLVRVYFPPHQWHMAYDHRSGATIAIAFFVLWLGRAHWLEVMRSMFRTPQTAANRRDRAAGWMFLLGVTGTAGWFIWAGVQPLWALFMTAVGFIIILVVTRIVAETGMPFLRMMDAQSTMWLAFMPQGWLTHISVYMSGLADYLFQGTSSYHASAIATHAMALQEEAPEKQTRQGVSSVLLFMLGLVVISTVTVVMAYRFDANAFGERPLFAGNAPTDWGGRVRGFDQSGIRPRATYNQPAAIAFGAGVAGGLQWACLNVPKWPVHPIGMLLARSYFGDTIWVSVFWGWLIKIMVLRFGGAGVYRKLTPLFIGLIFGEVLGFIFWILVAYVLIGAGLQYQPVNMIRS